MHSKMKVSALIVLSLSLLVWQLSWANVSDLRWSTFLGDIEWDLGLSISVDDSGNTYVTGYTESPNFPTTFGSYDTTYSDFDAFVAKLDMVGEALNYATFLGGSEEDWGLSIAVDQARNAYVTGYTFEDDFPTTPGAFDETHNGDYDAFVVKLPPTGDTLSYATFLGDSGWDEGRGIAADASGNAYVIGYTESDNFPATGGAFKDTLDGPSDAFVAKLNPTGSTLSYATYLGGSDSDEGKDIVVDNSQKAYVTGGTASDDFPTTIGDPHQGGTDVFVAKLNSTGSDLDYAILLGGDNTDIGHGIAVDDGGNAYITGEISSSNFPYTDGAFDTDYDGSTDAFVAKLNAAEGALVYSTFLGGDSYDIGLDIAVDRFRHTYATGETNSQDFPTTIGAYDTSYNDFGDIFVAKLSVTGSALDYSTFLGGNDYDYAHGIALDDSGNAYLTGETNSQDFPTTIGAYDTSYNDFGDAFVAKFLSADWAYAYIFGHVGSGPSYPDSGTVTFMAYLKKGGETDNEVLTEDSYNHFLGRDQGYDGNYFRVNAEYFISWKVEDQDSLIILLTGVGSEAENAGSIRDTVDIDVSCQDFGNSSWGTSINPTVPTGLEATNVSPGVVDLLWNSINSKNGSTSYRLYRSSQPSGAGNGASDGRYLRIAQALADTSYQDTDAPKGLCWYIVVAADSVAPDSIFLSGHSDEVRIDAALPVQLTSFTATGGQEMITLEWITESEWNNRGFHIYRRQESSENFQRITPKLIEGAGNSSEPRVYIWQDRRVENDQIYWYQLESVGFQGQTRTYGPVSAMPVEALPQAYRLNQNYPNPFNPDTWISYQLPEHALVSLKIYNIRGQLVNTLVDGEQAPGAYRVRWNGQDLQGSPAASGVYFCQISSGQFTETTKMVLLK